MTEYEKELVEQIKDYLKDTTYNYAVMLNGTWGTGKTHFVKNKLITSLHEEQTDLKIEYVSVYGCKSGSEVRDSIVSKILEDSISGMKQPIENAVVGDTYGDVKEKRKKEIRTASSFMKKVALSLLAKNETASVIVDALVETAEGMVDLSDYFIIIDDAERCLCSADEILGVINELVEHENAKVLIVANELEMGGYNRDNNLELKYAVASSNSITFDEAGNTTGKADQSFTPDTIRNRANKLFPRELLTVRYKTIREKLVGNVIEYMPAIVEVMHIIIDKEGGSEKLRGILHGQVNFYKEYMERYNHKNFRTFQFFISKVKFLYRSINQMALGEIDKTALLSDVVKDCFEASLAFKADVDRQDVKPDVQYGPVVQFTFVERYVQTGWYITSAAKDELLYYTKTYFVDTIPSDDPVTQLNKNYNKHDQKWSEDRLSEIQTNLEKNKYPVSQYGNILHLMMVFVEYGFSAEWFNNAYAQMKTNIEQSDGAIRPIELPKYMMSESGKGALIEAIGELNSLRSERNDHQSRLSFEEILHRKNWLKLLREYLENDLSMATKEPIFVRAQVTDWEKCLLGAEVGDIHDFSAFISEYYFYGIHRLIDREVKSMEELADRIHDAVETGNVEDLIKIQNLSALAITLSNLAEANKDNYI